MIRDLKGQEGYWNRDTSINEVLRRIIAGGIVEKS